MSNSTLLRYSNGNTEVTLLEDGTKIREYEGEPQVLHPETIDVKISDRCDMGCRYCHESSTKNGENADIGRLMEVLSELPAGVELAIGGGNPLEHPGLLNFLALLKEKGLIANLTVNQGHLGRYSRLLELIIKEDLIKGLGISITSSNFKYIRKLREKTDNIVFHLIAGVNKVEVIDNLLTLKDPKILVLGYKHFGFGVDYHSKEVDEEIRRWYMYLPRHVGKCVLSFDNLAIEQLNIKRLFTDEGWQRFYMGNDGEFSMYIDAVKGQYAPTSRSRDRVSFEECSLFEYFQNL